MTTRFPNGARFAFTILDDTDVATVANVEPMYRLLQSLGMFTTKTVWPLAHDGGWTAFAGSETLADLHYLEFVRDLARRGFQITWHGASMESSRRERTIEGLTRFRDLLGHLPQIHVNHSWNRENLYWGADRLDDPLLRGIVGRFDRLQPGWFSGHRPESEWWWGDHTDCFVYARNLTTIGANVLAFNPSMPYRDPRRPLIPWWFSACDADDADAFVRLLSPASLDNLERAGGVCLVATHLGKRFVADGEVDVRVRARLEDVARRRGWFVPVGTLLDHLRAERRGDGALPADEWRRMQYIWAWDTLQRAARRALRLPS